MVLAPGAQVEIHSARFTVAAFADCPGRFTEPGRNRFTHATRVNADGERDEKNRNVRKAEPEESGVPNYSGYSPSSLRLSSQNTQQRHYTSH